MSKYEKSNWIDNKTVIKAEHMQKIEQGIVDLYNEIENVVIGNVDLSKYATTEYVNEEVEELSSQLTHIVKNHVYISEFDGTVQEAIDYCISNKCDLIINKDLVVTETLKVNNNNGLGCRIVGTKNKPKITLDSVYDVPVFYFYGGSGFFSNTGIENITLATTNSHLNTAIKINGVCNAKFNNISISEFKYGIHLCNDTSMGTFTELNTFNDINLNYNINGIRIEQLLGDDSFHGNSFVNVYININSEQIGFNHVSGYYYNGNFRMYMWAHGEEATYLHCGGIGECNIGSITYESFEPGKITGSGRFWFRGNLTGIGGLNDETIIKSNGEKVISCDNYIKTISHSSLGNISSLSKGNNYNGINDGIYSIKNDNEKSFLVNGYDYNSDSKIYFGTTSYECDLDKMEPGMHITLKGDSLKTYSSDGLTIYDKNGDKCASFNNGELNVNAITGKAGNHNEVTVSASSEIQNVTLTGGIGLANIICLASVVVKGSNYEQRWLYSVNHDGYGNNGTCTELATHYTLNANGVEIKSITVDTNGNLVISVLTDRELTFITKYQGIGYL